MRDACSRPSLMSHVIWKCRPLLVMLTVLIYGNQATDVFESRSRRDTQMLGRSRYTTCIEHHYCICGYEILMFDAGVCFKGLWFLIDR